MTAFFLLMSNYVIISQDKLLRQIGDTDNVHSNFNHKNRV